MQISHETIYGYIYTHPKGELKKLMIHSLRRSKSKRGVRGSKSSSYSTIKPKEDQLICHRPKDINERMIAGHWEGDLIAGSQNKSCVGTLVERKTGYLILSKMKSKSAFDVRQGFEQKMKAIPEFLRLSMTYDRGSEMAQHSILSDNLKIDVYFADPHAPWQRGSNENTNGLIGEPVLKLYKGKSNISLKLKSIDGQLLNIKDFDNQVILINFWASWCKPCVKEIPSLVRLQTILKDKPFKILTVNVGESKQEIDAFIKKVKFDLPIMLDHSEQAVKDWGVYAYPSNFLLDKNGKIRYTYRGALEWDAKPIVKTIQSLF
ncbi:MAG: Mobile element protein [Candidatus Ruthia sp. Asou_11_S2]|nr:Mobile element protein [Candidatus Ruthia sp. Asou_11_S2]